MCGKGMMVVFEGIDGSGKTTIAIRLAKQLAEFGLKTLYTHEPYSAQLREVFNNFSIFYELPPDFEVLYMALDRAHHVHNVVEQFLNQGFIVIMDRYIYSSIAYQGALGVDLNWIQLVNSVFPRPDLALYLRVSLDTALSRIRLSKRIDKWKYFEYVERLRKAIEIYEMLVDMGVLRVVDGERTIETVLRECLDLVLKYL